MNKKLLIFIISFFLTIGSFIYKPQRLYAQSVDELMQQVYIEELMYTQGKCIIGNKCCVNELNDIKFPYSFEEEQHLTFPLNKIVGKLVGVANFFLDLTINPLKNASFKLFRNIFAISEVYCLTGYPSSNDKNNCLCEGENLVLSRFCNNIKDDKEKSECMQCIGIGSEGENEKGVWTAIGCIKGDLNTFIRDKVFGWGVGLAGVIALFCIIYAAFQLQTSQGSPEKIKKAQELLTSCIMGLMLIIFSVFILKLIGVDILRIPGFGG